MGKVSIIIPLYNAEQYIARAIGSVLAQTYQDFELVVVDDGSTDSGVAVVRSFQDQRIKLVKQSNSGPGAARNRGVRESTASYLCFLDADDEWMPYFLERYLEAITENPQCDYVVGPIFEGADKIDKSVEWKSSDVFEGAWELPLNATYVDFSRWLYLLHFTSAMVCTRDVFKRYGGFYTKNGCRYGEDRYLQCQLFLNHRLHRLVEPLVWYHSETNGLATTEDGQRPLNPILIDPEPIRKSCAPRFRSLFEEWLWNRALGDALYYAQHGTLSKSRILIQRFPMMKKRRRKFVRLCHLHVTSLIRKIICADRFK